MQAPGNRPEFQPLPDRLIDGVGANCGSIRRPEPVHPSKGFADALGMDHHSIQVKPTVLRRRPAEED